jgi:hypothetical protein
LFGSVWFDGALRTYFDRMGHMTVLWRVIVFSTIILSLKKNQDSRVLNSFSFSFPVFSRPTLMPQKMPVPFTT